METRERYKQEFEEKMEAWKSEFDGLLESIRSDFDQKLQDLMFEGRSTQFLKDVDQEYPNFVKPKK